MGHLWTFTDAVPSDRVERMLAVPSFEHVVQLVCAADVVGYKWMPRREEPLDRHRAEFILHVGRDLHDAFFNSPVGLRAQYAICRERGIYANRLFVETMKERLVAFALTKDDREQLITDSVQGCAAKIWTDEYEAGTELISRGDDAIDFGRWTKHAGLGIKAPERTRIMVFGAWLHDADGREWPDPEKACRAETIHECGFI